MVKSLFVTASAGSGTTYRLTEEVRHIENDKSFVVAATFTRTAAAEMEERILARIDKEKVSAALKLRLIMQAAKVHYSTIDSLFHQFLSTESYVPQVADDHEKELIVKTVDGRFFQHPQVVTDTQNILIAARILRMPPEKLLDELDESQESLAAWECPDTLLDDLIRRQKRLDDRYENLQKRVRAVAEETRGALRSQVVNPLLEPLSDVDLSRALFRKADLTEVKVAATDNGFCRTTGPVSRDAPARRRTSHQHEAAAQRVAQALQRAENLLDRRGEEESRTPGFRGHPQGADRPRRTGQRRPAVLHGAPV
jgi:superfamily I DNA/RNA helicase